MKLKVSFASKVFITGALIVAPIISLAQVAADTAGCTTAQFVIGTANNRITTAGMAFTPKCLRVKVGATVTIDGSARHPLASMPDIGGVRNPFATGSNFITPQTRVMKTRGTFGYFCDAHGNINGSGMAGVIVVE
ncbi:MAG: hypothetical protein H7061_06430 [Bdellovibrionaceae bacterium]|nr:hypothetical protein [Bdellovibrio sp.]